MYISKKLQTQIDKVRKEVKVQGFSCVLTRRFLPGILKHSDKCIGSMIQGEETAQKIV